MSTIATPNTVSQRPSHLSQRLLMTEEEYDSWHDDELTGEWVDGEVELMSPVSTRQMTLQIWLTKVLGMYIDFHQLGLLCGPEYTIRIPKPRRRRMPDLFFLASARTSLLTATLCDGPPDMALEIVAPESTSRDYRVKFQEYEAFGISEYWIIDPQAEIVEASLRDANGVYQPIPNIEGRITSMVVPGWFLKPEWLWTDPPRNSIEVLRELKVM
jgi:Uma2 family endonuclease